MNIEPGQLKGSHNNAFLLTRILRAARLMKLIRLVKYRRVYRRVSSRFNIISRGKAVALRTTTLLLLVAHWFACAFALLATLHDTPYNTYWATRNFCPRSDRASYVQVCVNDTLVRLEAEHAPETTFVERCQITISAWYIASFTWAILVVTGTGGTDEFPSSKSVGENIFICFFNGACAPPHSMCARSRTHEQ
jgi:hypothetical protein